MTFLTLGDICTIEKGSTGITKAISGKYPLVVTGEERKSHNQFQFDDEAVIVPLVSSTGHGHRSLKRIHYQSGKFALGTILCAIIPKDKKQLSTEYLYWYLNLNKERELVSRMKGMANVTLPLKEIAQIEIPVPPLEYQRRLVERFKNLQSKSTGLSAELTHQLDLVKQLRQAFLREAMQAKLVPQDLNDEPASELLKRIKAEKEKLIREGKLKKEKPLPPIKPEEIPFEIPKGWVWCRLGEVCKRIHYGLNASARPEKKDVRLLRITDIQGNNVVWEQVPGCDYSQADLEAYLLSENDIVIARTGGTIGKTFLVRNLQVKSLFASYLIRAVPSGLVSAMYVKYFLESPLYWDQLLKVAWGVGQPNVNGSSLSNLILPLPSISGQKLVVDRLTHLIQYCDDIEQNIKESQNRNEAFVQQVLREVLEVH